MKHRLSLLKTTLLLIGGGLVALTSFTSCDNFMKSGQVRDEIVDAIAYNNAPSCAVNFTDEGMGEFLGNKKETFKVGYAVQIQFEVNQDDYYFTGFEAVTNDSEKTPLSDSVKFENADDDNRNASKGIYKYNVTILKQSKNILIRPVCKLLPKITQITPKFESSGCDQDTPIQITFNKAVNSETFNPASISIFADEDLAQYFNTPQLTSDKKTIYISQKELILKPNDTKNFLNIEVDYNFTSLKDADGLTLTAQGTHSYKINKSFGEQKFVKVQPETDDAYGKFLSTEEKQCTVGYTVDIQFTLKKQDYKFVKFVPVITNGTIETPADCVIFENEEYDDQTGIYKASVKVTKALNDNEKIVIRPECMIIPKITSVYPPKDNTSYPQDTSIKIYFNKAIKLSDFADQNGFLKNIIITTGSQDLLDNQNGKTPYYKSPYLEDEGKTLVIPFVSGNYLISDNQSKDIKVTLQLEGLKDAVEGENVLFAQNEYSFTYKINGEKDSTPPVLKTLNIARTQQDAVNGTNLITLDQFTHYATKINYGDDSSQVAANIQNHHVNKVWVYFEAEDADSGASYLEIKEQLIRDTSAVEKEGIVFDKANSDSNCINNQSGRKIFKGSFEYDFKSFEDGVVKLEFCLFDYAGKSVSKTVDLVKDTVCALTSLTFNDVGEFQDDSENQPYTITIVPLLNDSPYLRDLDGNEYCDTVLTANENDFSGCSKIIGFEYGYDEKNLSYIDLSEQEGESVYAQNYEKYYKRKSVDFFANPYKKIIIHTIMQDTAGNMTTISDVIPATPEVIFSDIKIDDFRFVLNNISGYSQNQIVCNLIKDGSFIATIAPSLIDNSTVSLTTLGGTYVSVDNLPDGDYSVRFFVRSEYNNGKQRYSYRSKNSVIVRKSGSLVSLLTDTGTATVTENDIPDFSVTVENPVINSSNRIVHIKYNNFEPNPEFNYLIYYEGINSKGYSVNKDFTVPSEYGSYSFKILVFDKQNNSVESQPKTLDLSYDNVPPVIPKIFRNNYLEYEQVMFNKSTLRIKIEDRNLGSENLSIKYIISNDSLKNIDWKNDNRVQISKLTKSEEHENEWLFDILYYEKSCPYHCYVYVQDAAGNYAEQQSNLLISKSNTRLSIAYLNSAFYLSGSGGTKIIKYISDNEWKNCADSNMTFTESEKSSFISAQNYSHIDVGADGYKYSCSAPIYFYPPYFIAKNTETPLVCDLKDICMGQSGLNVLADQPCFVHTMYCPHKLGNTPEDWLDGGIETGLVMKQKSFTYTWDNTSQVPDDYYYAIIVHFADGTMLMSPVIQR